MNYISLCLRADVDRFNIVLVDLNGLRVRQILIKVQLRNFNLRFAGCDDLLVNELDVLKIWGQPLSRYVENFLTF